ncbi:MAG TPA: GYF domain-containing protein, partial [Anaeromyxobacteraceae bacterium]|nr:GYF domain-containing protein [Anaeromyxobacteraceae bacterium]
MPETLWYYEDSGRQAGPVSETALRELIRSGRLGPSARVWRSGMAGWQPWPSVSALAGAPAAGTAAPATAARGLDVVDLPLLVILSIVTFGIYGLVVFYRAGDAYGRLAPARRSNFETLFWIYVAAWVLQATGWFTFGAPV